MRLSELLRGTGIAPSGGDPEISGLDYDSRRVQPGARQRPSSRISRARRSREWMRRVRDPVCVDVLQSRLLAIGTRQPAEQMVERTVLHHHYDDMVDTRPCRRRQRTGRLEAADCTCRAACESRGPDRGRAGEDELPSR